jgi:hypothetical protein
MPSKVWLVLLEEVNYNPETIFNIAKTSSVEPFNRETRVEEQEIFDTWKKEEYPMEKRMIYNMNFLENIEDFLISNGIHFNWIQYSGNYVGIRIHPTGINFNAVLSDCMTFEKFSWHRHSYMSIKEKQEKEK